MTNWNGKVHESEHELLDEPEHETYDDHEGGKASFFYYKRPHGESKRQDN